jgi:hypothetical protein
VATGHVETFYGPALGILEVEILVDQTPLDTVAGRKIALLFLEHVDLGGAPQPRIPLDRPAMLID